MSIDLHKLANTSGYGAADKILRESGHPRSGDNGDTYTVKVEFSVSYTVDVEVLAFNESEAKSKARSDIMDDPEMRSAVENVEIYSMVVTPESTP